MAGRRGISAMAQKKLIVLVDLDETLAGFEEHFLNKYRQTYPNEPYIPLEDRNTFYISDQYDTLTHSDDCIKTDLKKIYRSQYFFRDLPEIEGGCKAVKEMAEMEGVEVFICSSPLFQYTYSTPEKFEWVENHLGKDWINRLILTRDKTLIHGHILIDDLVDIKGVIKKPPWQHIVFMSCHNKHRNLKGKTCLQNWTDGTWRTLIEDFKKRF